MKRASNILSEREMRRQYERLTGNLALVGKHGENYSRAYATWLEDTVRIWWPELSAMMHRETKKTIAQAEQRRKQPTLFGGMQ